MNIKRPFSAKQEKRDELIGTALAKTIAASTDAGPCPGSAEMVDLVQGALSQGRRDSVMGHIASCEDCYELYLRTQTLCREEKAPAKRGRLMLPLGGLAIICALAAFSYYWTLQRVNPSPVASIAPPKGTDIAAPAPGPKADDSQSPTNSKAEFIPQTAAQIASGLISSGINETDIAFATTGSDSSFAFSGSTTRERFAFSLGARAVDFETALRSRNWPEAAEQMKKILGLLGMKKDAQRLQEEFRLVQARMQNETDAGKLYGSTESLKAIFIGKEEQFYYEFGEWAEGGRLAVAAGKTELVTLESVRYFSAGIRGKDLPKGVFGALNGIEAILSVKQDKQTKLKRYFDDLALILDHEG